MVTYSVRTVHVMVSVFFCFDMVSCIGGNIAVKPSSGVARAISCQDLKAANFFFVLLKVLTVYFSLRFFYNSVQIFWHYPVIPVQS